MKSLGMVFLVLAGVLIGVALVLDGTFRERMASIGYRKALFQGGALTTRNITKSGNVTAGQLSLSM